MVLNWGIANLEAPLGAQNIKLAEQLNAMGLPCPDETRRGPHYLGALLPENAPADLTKQLAAEHIYVSKRGNSLRITPHLYNTQDDMDRLIEALERTLSRNVS